jgi:hypothetical protein
MTDVHNKLERMWKEAIMAKFEILSWQLPIDTKENYGKPQHKEHHSQDLTRVPPE